MAEKRHRKDYFKRILELFSSGRYDSAVTEEIHAWLSDREHADKKEAAMRDLWEASSSRIPGSRLQHSLDSVYAKAGVCRDRKTVRLRWSRHVAAAAAVVLTFFLTWHYTKQEYVHVAMLENYTKAGARQEFVLPDGTVVHANSSTLLIYPERFTGDTRTVFLVGEADFKVSKDARHPFVVKSSTMSVTALGTEFNISAYSENGNMTATLIEGSVEVKCGEAGDTYILEPGEQVIYSRDSGTSRVSEADMESVTAWQTGILVFRGVTLGEIIVSLEKKYGVRIDADLSGHSSDRFNFRFNENAGLEEILGVIAEVAGGFEYEISE